jgi:hypothetical protein
MNSTPNTIAMVIGAGAIENAWLHVIKALGPVLHKNANSDTANCFFARLVYLMRYYATGHFEGQAEGYERILKFTSELKRSIADHLQFAQENRLIGARLEIFDILKKYILKKGPKAVFITTNWDTILDKMVNLMAEHADGSLEEMIKVWHVHGSIVDPERLYLPSEVIKEPYRRKDDDIRMGVEHVTMVQAVEQCQTTILYGLSLDPLDAELMQMLAKGWHSGIPREVIVINPAHELVAGRVRLLFPDSSEIKISGFLPGDLKNEHVHFY